MALSVPPLRSASSQSQGRSPLTHNIPTFGASGYRGLPQFTRGTDPREAADAVDHLPVSTELLGVSRGVTRRGGDQPIKVCLAGTASVRRAASALTH